MAAEESKGGLSLSIDIPTETAVKLEVRVVHPSYPARFADHLRPLCRRRT